jgi:hypothetical protein
MSQVTWAGLVLDQQVAGLLVVPDLHAASDRRWVVGDVEDLGLLYFQDRTLLIGDRPPG